jgi:hypothetical protein
VNIKECFVRFSSETFDEEILILVSNIKKLKKKAKTAQLKRGIFFQFADLEFYQSLLYFYAKDFESSLNSLNKSQKLSMQGNNSSINNFKFTNLTYNIFEY